MSPVRTIRLAPEYGCWPTWDDATGDNIDPRDLPVPSDLAERIAAWDDRFQATLNPDYPPDSAFSDAAAEDQWRSEGQAILLDLIAVLGADRVRRRF